MGPAWGVAAPRTTTMPPGSHLQLSSRDSASGIEVQGHHHGEAGGSATLARGHTAEGPQDGEGGLDLLHWGGARGTGQDVTPSPAPPMTCPNHMQGAHM